MSVTTEKEERPTVLARAVKHRRKIAAGVGLVLSMFVCPQLPEPYKGPCRMAAQALRTYLFDGLDLEGAP